MLKCYVMLKNKYLFFLLSINLSIFLFIFVSVNSVFATPVLSSFLLNGNSQDVTFNPHNGEKVDIQININEPVKFTRVYICSSNAQTCNQSGSSRYFSPNATSATITELWDGKASTDKDALIVSDGEYIVVAHSPQWPDILMTHSIFIDSSSTTTPGSIICSTFTYSDWGVCSNNTQTRTVATSSPSDCTGGLPVLTQNCTAGSTSTSAGTQTTKIVTRTIYVSTHSGEEDLSDYNEKSVFEVAAGRERVALVGAPIEFGAKYNLLKKDQCAPSFRWSFGDGFDVEGRNVTHTYKYPGKYQIVLNGACGDYNSISRTIVKVESPAISILSLENGDTEVLNNGNTEINIGNWKIKGGQKDFVFPKDTIIGEKNKIILSKEDLSSSYSTGKMSISNPSDIEVAYYIKNNEQRNTGILFGGSSISVIEAEKLLKEYKTKSTLSVRQNNKIESVKEDNVIKNPDKNAPDNKNTVPTAFVESSADSSSTKNFLAKLFDIPVKGIKSIAHIFYDF